MNSPKKRILSLALALSMGSTMAAIPVTAAEEDDLTVSTDCIELSGENQFTVTLKVDKNMDSAPTDWEAWANELTWSLTRDKSEKDEELFPNIYTGDDLQNWQTWNNEPYFSEIVPDVEVGSDEVTITLDLTTKHFMSDNIFTVQNRNVFSSFNGMYTLAAESENKVIAETEVEVDIYESYREFGEIGAELEAISIAAQSKGRYMDIEIIGYTTSGLPQYVVTMSDASSSVDAYKSMNNLAMTNPSSLQKMIKDETFTDYRIPLFLNNVHSDEHPGVSIMMDLMWDIATKDEISYNTLTGMADGSAMDMSIFDEQVVDLGISGLGTDLLTKDAEGNKQYNTGTNDASELYTISDDITYSVDDLLDNIILVVSPVENADGYVYNSRRNENGFDLNRDATNQTQVETQNLFPVVAEWNPAVFIEYHGYVKGFLIDPCTPPHEPNLEYDLLVQNSILGSEAFGMAALGTMSERNSNPETAYDSEFWCYRLPLRDDFDPVEGWSYWDDLATNYGPSYAMLNSGSIGYTIESPWSNQANSDLLLTGTYGYLDFMMENKDEIYLNQLEFFARGLDNEDARANMEPWYADNMNNELPADTWRIPHEETDNFFPEYYVIPTNTEQRDPADAYEMAQFLIDNGVVVSELTADVTIGDVTYKKGDYVVDMQQAKRNYANAVLWNGADTSDSGFPSLYSEAVANFSETRGFTCDTITTPDAFAGALATVETVTAMTTIMGEGAVVIVENNGDEVIRAINNLLNSGEKVGLITDGDDMGDFAMDYATYTKISGKYALVAKRTNTMPTAYQIEQPEVFITGRYDEFDGYTIDEGYFAEWFEDGFGFTDYANVHLNGTSNYDVMGIEKQMQFKVTDDASDASVIVGSTMVTSGANGDEAAAAVKSGTPYIAINNTSNVKNSPLTFIRDELLPGQFDFSSLGGMESLHKVTYPTDHIITANSKESGDDVIYSYGTGYITTIPTGAEILIKGASGDSHLAGAMPDDASYNGLTEAIAYESDTLDLTVFANSIFNRSHQQDDYNFVATTIFSKSLAEKKMTIEGAESVQFDDVTPTDWFYDAVMYAYNNGLFTGISDTEFQPNTTMTRSMLVTVLHRVAGTPEPTGELTFADVEDYGWYADGIQWASETGIVSGYNEDTFGTHDAVTREQLVTILWRYDGEPRLADYEGLTVFEDVSEIDDYAQSAFAWAHQKGLVTGKTETTLDPNGSSTRAEVATILMRYQEMDSEQPPVEAETTTDETTTDTAE